MAIQRPEKDREAYNRQLKAYKDRCSHSMSWIAKQTKHATWDENEEEYWW